MDHAGGGSRMRSPVQCPALDHVRKGTQLMRSLACARAAWQKKKPRKKKPHDDDEDSS
jgi:hypothetical protein